MSGLEKIIDKINKQSREDADRIMAETEKKVVEIERGNQEKLEKEVANINARRERERALLKDRLISNGELDARNLLLECKQEIINKAFEMTLKELKNISHEDYVQYVKQRISGETSTLVLQDGREAAVKKALPNVKVLKEKTVESGFIEVVDNIENNYTFQALLHIEKDESQVELAEILFEK